MQSKLLFDIHHSQIPISIFLFEVNTGNCFQDFDKCFAWLKLNNFNFSNYADKPDAYSNYSIDQIEKTDFLLLSQSWQKSIENELVNWAKQYKAIDTALLEMFIKEVVQKSESFIADFAVYKFNLKAQEYNEKRHLYFSLFEYFTSFLFFNNCYEKIFYLEMSYG